MSPSSDPPPRLVRLSSTGSTQDAARRLLDEQGIPAGATLVVTTTDQRAGRGRLGRAWNAAPGDGLALTYAHPSSLEPSARSWYPLVAGLAVLDAITDVLGADAAGGLGLKWPNDVHDVSGRKLAGILAEATGGGHVLIGIGVNLAGVVRDRDGQVLGGTVSLADLRRDGGSSAPGDQAADARHLEQALMGRLHEQLATLDDAGGDAEATGQASRYRETCVTLGGMVRVMGAGSQDTRHGSAEGIDRDGRLLVTASDGTARAVAAGDVQHVRAAAPQPPSARTAEPGSAAGRTR